MNSPYNNFYSGKKVFVTGHTGFKGSWLSLMLHSLGAEVHGYSLEPPTQPNLFEVAEINNVVHTTLGDIRDYSHLKSVLCDVKPDIIFHLAAQPLVRESYKNPVETYSTNVMGTVNLLEAVRKTGEVKALVNVTTDKCYENKEWLWGYRENETLGGYDPYSNSKACSELVTQSYRNSFFNPEDYKTHGLAIATARAGNVIGGGDWAADRLIPDFIRAVENHETVLIRNPKAIRPWQHVLDPLNGYLMLAEKLYTNGPEFGEAWNFGPSENDARTVEWIVKTICQLWGEDTSFEIENGQHPHEAHYLKLDCTKARTRLGWSPKTNLEDSLASIVNWNKALMNGQNMRQVCLDKIENYFQRK